MSFFHYHGTAFTTNTETASSADGVLKFLPSSILPQEKSRTLSHPSGPCKLSPTDTTNLHYWFKFADFMPIAIKTLFH
jgi:hypothetical protein